MSIFDISAGTDPLVFFQEAIEHGCTDLHSTLCKIVANLPEETCQKIAADIAAFETTSTVSTLIERVFQATIRCYQAEQVFGEEQEHLSNPIPALIDSIDDNLFR
ncbi:hypothetical protein [Aliiroseovarius sp. 2305UL8-7]|uniref:hypothetical protein n=1 Tax=Aliiroseovarius conchicola TaxID=3121637 RepID=UPI0035278EA3